MSNVVNLRKGQRVELAKGVSKLRVELTWQASRKAETWDLGPGHYGPRAECGAAYRKQ